MEVLRQNGFELQVESNGDDDRERLKLVALPISKSTVFDMKGIV